MKKFVAVSIVLGVTFLVAAAKHHVDYRTPRIHAVGSDGHKYSVKMPKLFDLYLASFEEGVVLRPSAIEANDNVGSILWVLATLFISSGLTAVCIASNKALNDNNISLLRGVALLLDRPGVRVVVCAIAAIAIAAIIRIRDIYVLFFSN